MTAEARGPHRTERVRHNSSASHCNTATLQHCNTATPSSGPLLTATMSGQAIEHDAAGELPVRQERVLLLRSEEGVVERIPGPAIESDGARRRSAAGTPLCCWFGRWLADDGRDRVSYLWFGFQLRCRGYRGHDRRRLRIGCDRRRWRVSMSTRRGRLIVWQRCRDGEQASAKGSTSTAFSWHDGVLPGRRCRRRAW
jgi:hypothetical protein